MKDLIAVRVSVIDDDKALCAAIGDWLGSERYDVETFNAARSALSAFAQHAPDLGLIDLRLPDMEAPAAVAELRKLAPHTRLIGLVAFPEPAEVAAALQAGANGVLEKPIRRAALLDEIRRQLAAIGIVMRTEGAFNAWLGAGLRELRQSRQRTQSEIATLAGITAAQLSQIELGRTGTSTWTLARICAALKTPLDRLFTRP
jgi:CheY-like chemotaxis protein/DNA-binding Xre family transcriptional regulator